MDLHHHHIKILAFSLHILFLLANSSFAAATAPSQPPSSSSSIAAAAETLRSHGYSLYASTLVSTFSNAAKLSGTILAAPDFIFAFSPSLTSRALPRPSTTLLLYHSLKPPSLRWQDLNSRLDGDELPTLHSDYCLFLFKNPNGELSVASSKKPVLAVNIRQPDLYVDANLTIHGVDGVLDPSTATKCSKVFVSDPVANVQSWVHRSFLDRAIRMLRKRGFHVAATALSLLRPELLNLPAVTVFAPSDNVLFANSVGFRYNARRHVVPERLLMDRMTSFAEGTEFETLAPNKTIFVESGNDVVTVNGARIDGVELYKNKWIILYSIEPMTLDDALGESQDRGRWYESLSAAESQIPVEMSNQSVNGNVNVSTGVPPVASSSTGKPIEPPSPAPASSFLELSETGVPGVSPASGQEYVEDIINKPVKPPAQSPSQFATPVIGGSTDIPCDAYGVTVGVDSSSRFCPANEALEILPESEQIQSAPDEPQFEPTDDIVEPKISKRLLQSEPTPLISEDKERRVSDPTNMAGDLFFYI
ncbi:OLC1v1001792C1 [Oldenlandia corymbosa var. corymbosa]|uniref:OLC1v1001792C1 n=1 Tax=Oldenlandia corymbosa var. corymbosa TaxID=529605 RepID=A0AAV1D8L3_OLDCO|nr:OLC1v1001792C1 [Oldenlandia corymbosa var. corymbosa]